MVLDAVTFHVEVVHEDLHVREDGSDNGGIGGQREYRTFYVFDVPELGGTIVKAELQLYNPAGGYVSSDASERLTLYDVSTPITELRDGGSGLTGIFTDLGSGVTYGTRTVSAADNETLVSVRLNATFRNIAQTGGEVAIGAALTTLTTAMYSEERIFATSSNSDAVQLKLTTAVLLPDGRIRVGTSGAFIGNGVYNTTGLGQSVTRSVARGATATYGISVENDGNNADEIKVVGGDSTAKFRVKYLRGTTNITTAVVNGTYRTPSLAPGATLLITMKVTVLSGAAVGDKLKRSVTLSSEGDPLRKDVVKVTTKRS